MFSSNECTIYFDTICLVQMSVQYTWQYMFSSNECTIYLTYMFGSNSVQYTWQYMYSSNECTIYLTVMV